MATTLNVLVVAHAPATAGPRLKQSCHNNKNGTIHILKIETYTTHGSVDWFQLIVG
jgi:hypothetical protein